MRLLSPKRPVGGRLYRSANLARDDPCLAPVSPRTEGRYAGDRFRWRVRAGETSRLASRTRLPSRSSECVTCLNPLYPCHLFKFAVTLSTVAIASPLQSPPGAGWFGASHLPGNRRPHPIHRHRWIFECRKSSPQPNANGCRECTPAHANTGTCETTPGCTEMRAARSGSTACNASAIG
jgi:hypothetical protein